MKTFAEMMTTEGMNMVRKSIYSRSKKFLYIDFKVDPFDKNSMPDKNKSTYVLMRMSTNTKIKFWADHSYRYLENTDILGYPPLFPLFTISRSKGRKN